MCIVMELFDNNFYYYRITSQEIEERNVAVSTNLETSWAICSNLLPSANLVPMISLSW